MPTYEWVDSRVCAVPYATCSCTVQAAIDGLVLLAMNSRDWTNLAARSSHPSCDAPLESLRRASLTLSPRFQIENAVLLPDDDSDSVAHEQDDADQSRRKREGDDDDDDDCEEIHDEGITNISPSPPDESGEATNRPAGNSEEGSENIIGASKGYDTRSPGRGTHVSLGNVSLSSDCSRGRKQSLRGKKQSLLGTEVHLPSGERLRGK